MEDDIISEIKKVRSVDAGVVAALLSVIGDKPEYHTLMKRHTLMSVFDLDDLDDVQFVMNYEQAHDCTVPDEYIWNIRDLTLGEVESIFLYKKITR